MIRKASFSDSFWGLDFLSTAGYDALKKRLKEGKQTCLAIEQFLRLRAKAEEDYGKSLQKVCKTQETQEMGTLRTGWDNLREQTERIAQIHLEASGLLIEAAARLNEFCKRQKAEKTPRDNAVCQSAKEKAATYRKTLELKRTYESKSSEAEQADVVVKKAKPNENNFSTRDWDKMIQKQTKSQMDAQKADGLYRDSISKLDQTRIQWEKDMISYCDLCESLEESRLKMLQNEMWICCNIVSANCVDEDQCCEITRSALERVNVDTDIQSFINKAATGTEKPVPLKFEPYQLLLSAPAPNLNVQTDNENRLSNLALDHGRVQLPLPPPPGTTLIHNKNYTTNR